MKPNVASLTLAALLLFSAGSAAAETLSADEIAFFEKKVRPILVEKCHRCHSHEAEKLKGNLHLDSRHGWEEGGDNGPAIVPGNVEESLLVKAIRYTDNDLEMPPKEKLSQAAIDALERWVAMGAPDPRDGVHPDAKPERGIDLEEGRKLWCFQPVRPQEVPAVEDTEWGNNAIDRFILAKLEEQDLDPAPPADPVTLLRRLHVDLAGLPPAPDEVPPFQQSTINNQQSAIENLVNRLLASPRFGERWGRHWLDLARYADSSGGGASDIFPDAWKYRDYVIRSFNEDKPFDEFAAQQLAGDLLPSRDAAERIENIVATAFLVLGPRNYINNDHEAFKMDGVDEQLDTVGRAFLGMTIGCARCHDHKFDPIPAVDYYALAGFFTSTESADPIPGTMNLTWNVVADPREDPDGSRLRDYEAKDARYKDLRKELGKLKSGAEPGKAELARLQSEVDAAKAAVPKKPAVLMGVANSPGTTGDCRLRIRGNPHQAGEAIPRGFLQVAFPNSDSARAFIPPRDSGRLQLANWITSTENPLTARVYVNRIWQHLMGEGLVRTVDNFGTTGDKPSHPELLDWLATRFRESGGSTKDLVRLIVTSKTYQLGASEPGSKLIRADPGNRLFGRRARRSLDAETMRDSMLMACGILDLTPVERPFPASLRNEFSYEHNDGHCRSIYLPRFRNNLFELFETFDVANPATTVGRRDLTILPTQALFLMNNDYLIERSREAAARLLEDNSLSAEKRVEVAYLRTLARRPGPAELRIALEFLDSGANPAETGIDSESLERWAAFQQSLFACIDFRYLK